MIRRHSILLTLAALAALAILSACESSTVSSPGAPDPGMTATGPTNGAAVAQDHGGGNGNGGGNGHNNNGDDNDSDNDNGDEDHGGNDHDGGNNGQASCPAAGNKVEIEGTITARGATTILVHQQGKKDFLCLVNRATTIRKGNRTYSLAQLQNGWRVHVKGTGQAISTSSTSCTATAREIKVQNNH